VQADTGYNETISTSFEAEPKNLQGALAGFPSVQVFCAPFCLMQSFTGGGQNLQQYSAVG